MKKMKYLPVSFYWKRAYDMKNDPEMEIAGVEVRTKPIQIKFPKFHLTINNSLCYVSYYIKCIFINETILFSFCSTYLLGGSYNYWC